MENEIWPWFDGEYKVHCQEQRDYEEIMLWDGTRDGGNYSLPDGTTERDVIIPEEHKRQASRLLGVGIKRS